MRFIVLLLLLQSGLSWKYPYNPSIHMFGNHGFLGRVHAEVAPIFTTLIDKMVYDKDVRSEVLEEETKGYRVLDIGCGVGFSTSKNEGSLGIDTSLPMIEKARSLFPSKNFEVGHGEYWLSPNQEFDVVTVMYMFHEAPQMARHRMIEHAKKIAKKKVIIVDISPNYIPSHSMLAGEPYLKDYLSNIKSDLDDFTETTMIPGHVHCWIYKHNV